MKKKTSNTLEKAEDIANAIYSKTGYKNTALLIGGLYGALDIISLGTLTSVINSFDGVEISSRVKPIEDMKLGETAYTTMAAIIFKDGQPIAVKKDYHTIPENSGVIITRYSEDFYAIDLNGNEL